MAQEYIHLTEYFLSYHLIIRSCDSWSPFTHVTPLDIHAKSTCFSWEKAHFMFSFEIANILHINSRCRKIFELPFHRVQLIQSEMFRSLQRKFAYLLDSMNGQRFNFCNIYFGWMHWIRVRRTEIFNMFPSRSSEASSARRFFHHSHWIYWNSFALSHFELIHSINSVRWVILTNICSNRLLLLEKSFNLRAN